MIFEDVADVVHELPLCAPPRGPRRAYVARIHFDLDLSAFPLSVSSSWESGDLQVDGVEGPLVGGETGTSQQYLSIADAA